MRLFSLIGIVLVLALPFAFVQDTFGNISQTTTSAGLLWITTQGEFFGFQGEDTSFFEIDWISEDGLYHVYFGQFWYVGIIIVILLLLGIFSAITGTQNKNRTTAALLLLLSGIGLLVLRLLVLSDRDLSFYSSSDGFIERTYIEIPVGFIIALVFSILDFRNSK